MPDERREQVIPRAMHVTDEQLAEAARAILFRPLPFERLRTARPFHLGRRRRVAGADLLAPVPCEGLDGGDDPGRDVGGDDCVADNSFVPPG